MNPCYYDNAYDCFGCGLCPKAQKPEPTPAPKVEVEVDTETGCIPYFVTARLMAEGDDSGFDWDAWKDQMKEERAWG